MFVCVTFLFITRLKPADCSDCNKGLATHVLHLIRFPHEGRAKGLESRGWWASRNPANQPRLNGKRHKDLLDVRWKARWMNSWVDD
jgi:hypothetical protein